MIVAIPIALFCLIAIAVNCLVLWNAIRTANDSPPELLEADDGWKLIPPWRETGGLYSAIRNFVAFGFGIFLYIILVQMG